MARPLALVAFILASFFPLTCGFQVLQLSKKGVTEVAKVTELLEKLRGEVEAEGEKEAKTYDKFACFVKEQADQKRENVEKRDAKIESLDAFINEKNAEKESTVDDVENEETGLNKKIADGQALLDSKTTELQEHLHSAKKTHMDLSLAIEAVQQAKASLVESRDKTTRDTALASVKEAITKVVGDPSAAAGFSFQSGDIIAVLTDLEADFKKQRAQKEADNQDKANMKKTKISQCKSNLRMHNQDKQDATEKIQRLQDALDEATATKEQTIKDRDAAEAFLNKVLERAVQQKQMFTKNVDERTTELNALTEAIKVLKKEGVEARHNTADRTMEGTVFLQISSQRKPWMQVVTRLQSRAKSLDSNTLSLLASKMSMVSSATGNDPFVKVRELIDDLVAKLEADADREKTAHDECKKNLNAAASDLDEANVGLESARRGTSEAVHDIKTQTKEIALNKKDIVNSEKDKQQSMKERQEFKEENDITIEEAIAGKAAVEKAIEILQKVFDEASFIQKPEYDAAEDASGQTSEEAMHAQGVDEITDKKNNNGAARSIIELLNVILTDFEHTIDTTKIMDNDQEASKDEIVEFLDAEINTAEESIDTAKDSLADAEGKLNEEVKNEKDSKESKDSSTDKIDDLKEDCVNTADTYEDRKAKRKQEIEALQEAQTILREVSQG